MTTPDEDRTADEARAAVEAYLHEHIPISSAMGVAVVRAETDGVALEAPLEPNVNHRSTAFGGSCAAVAILAAWTLVHLRVRAAGFEGRVVIQRGATDYLLPIHGPFVATCTSPDASVWDRFHRALNRRGQARIELDAVVTSEGATVATFNGTYVAIARP